jgi:hypothetical protein
LQMTKSTLVLLDIVAEEVLGQYRRELKKRYKALAGPYQQLRGILASPTALPDKIAVNFAEHENDLAIHLLQPHDSVRSTLYSDTKSIDVKEVFKRGVHRTPPASDDGEELRDVIIWLLTLKFSKTVGELAFISNDSGFWTNNGPKDEIRKEAESSTGSLLLYRSIDQFIKGHAPTPEAVTVEWMAIHTADIGDNSLIVEAINREAVEYVKAVLVGWEPTTPSLYSMRFQKGNIFNTSDTTQFAELVFDIDLHASVTELRPSPAGWDHGSTDPRGGLWNINKLAYLANPTPMRVPVTITGEANISAYVEDGRIKESALQGLREISIKVVQEAEQAATHRYTLTKLANERYLILGDQTPPTRIEFRAADASHFLRKWLLIDDDIERDKVLQEVEEKGSATRNITWGKTFVG